MKRSITTALSVLLIAGIPLAAVAGILSAASGGESIASAVSVLVVGGGLIAWLGRSDTCRSDLNAIVQRLKNDYQMQWRITGRDGRQPGEIESAICGFETYINTVGSSRFAQLIKTYGRNEQIISQLMLEQAAELQPGAFRQYDRRGCPDQTTMFAREFFRQLVRGVVQALPVDDAELPVSHRVVQPGQMQAV